MHEEMALLIAESLTSDRRLQKALLINSDKMNEFLDYVREQGPDYYIRRLGVPRFEGSLLFDTEGMKLGHRSSVGSMQ